jgi:hypothetical protein
MEIVDMMMDPLVLTHSRKWMGQGRSALGNPHFLDSASGYSEIIKIAFDICKDNYLLEIIFAMFHFLFRSCLRTRGRCGGKGVPPLGILKITLYI